MVHSAFRMLLEPSSPFATDSSESSSSAIMCGQSDELSESAAIPGDNGDDLMSNKMPTHVTFRGKKKEEVPLMSKKEGNNARDPANSFEDGPSRDAELLIDEFMRFHPPPPYSKYPITGNLPCPVIIPQRRPRDWKRGFMRAYAPVLGDCGVSQDMFLDFLKTFDAVNRQLPLLQVINAAAFHVIHLPIITLIASTAVDFALEARAQSRTNAFLYRTNKEFFQPRGLYCLIMTYDPKSKETFTSVDITRSVSSVMKAKSSALRWMLLMSISSHSLELPEAAPLVYPIMDLGDPHYHPIRWTLKTLGNYFDRREQAKYARKRPPKALAAMAPTEQRAESWLGVRTVNPYPTSEVSEALDAQGRVTSYVEPGKRKEKPNKGTGRRWFKENVLYMMIVNMPTEADLAAVKGST